ncbi:hypothetical protein C8R45DRAFT_1223415 [Mycena sanguinolenta]|nr:hypothetical protein C8R45DRAFT_1223415 [Mycena sanguinolenta]
MDYIALLDTYSRPTNRIGTDTLTEIETYILKQKSRPEEDRYIHVSEREGCTAIFGIKHGTLKHIHDVRALDLDTAFEPVGEGTNLYEINGSDAGLVWEELLSLVKRLTAQALGFISLHRAGTLGVNADMEAAHLLGIADALLPTIVIPSVGEKVRDSVGVLKRNVRRWKHKEMHQWLLPGIMQCLADINPAVWHLMKATTKVGEAQHTANNAEKGTGLVQSFLQYEALHSRHAAEIEMMLQRWDRSLYLLASTSLTLIPLLLTSNKFHRLPLKFP